MTTYYIESYYPSVFKFSGIYQPYFKNGNEYIKDDNGAEVLLDYLKACDYVYKIEEVEYTSKKYRIESPDDSYYKFSGIYCSYFKYYDEYLGYDDDDVEYVKDDNGAEAGIGYLKLCGGYYKIEEIEEGTNNSEEDVDTFGDTLEDYLDKISEFIIIQEDIDNLRDKIIVETLVSNLEDLQKDNDPFESQMNKDNLRSSMWRVLEYFTTKREFDKLREEIESE